MAIAGGVGQKLPQVPGYAIHRLLGRGGMGEVWLAEHTTLHRTVALKVLRPELALDQDFVERFLREARAAARINHPAVVAVHDAGQDGGCLYLAMEYMVGGDLRSRMTTGRGLPLRAAVDWCLTAAAALQAIHDAGLVHRDIKPENILLDADGRAKIADLGLARTTHGDDRMTATGQAMGTPAYMSPEQATGVADVDARSDVYALGATLFALLTGRPPFIGATPWVVVAQVIKDPPPDPRTFTPELPGAVVRVLQRSLAKDRARRQASAQAFADELRAAVSAPSIAVVAHARPVLALLRRVRLRHVGVLLAVVSVVILWRLLAGASPSAVATPAVVTTTPTSVAATNDTVAGTTPRAATNDTAAGTTPRAATKGAVAGPAAKTAANDPAAATPAKSDEAKGTSNNPFLAIRDGFREVRTAVRGTLRETLPHTLSETTGAARAALRQQKLTVVKEHVDETSATLETRLADGDSLTITLRPLDSGTEVAIQIGAFGDQEKSRTVLGWITGRF